MIDRNALPEEHRPVWDTLQAQDDGAAHPVIFGFTAEQEAVCRDLLAHARTTGIAVHDRIEEQLDEWVRIVSPETNRDPQARRSLIDQAFAQNSQGARFAYGRWCYFPWRRALIHLLPPEQFFRVRTSRNRQKITQEEQRLLVGKRIGIVGLSVGHASALAIAQEAACGELRIADFDVIELSNLNRLGASVLQLGEPKARASARALAEANPYLHIRVFAGGISDANLEEFLLADGALDLVIEECDTLPMKLAIREAARRCRIPVLMETNERGTLDVERFDREPERPVLHGLLGQHTPESLRALSPPQQLAVVCSLFGGLERMSSRVQDSLTRLGRELTGYPQLASEVNLGAALITHAARRILLGQLTASGRVSLDLDQLVSDATLVSTADGHE